jgi:hypothetical protein
VGKEEEEEEREGIAVEQATRVNKYSQPRIPSEAKTSVVFSSMKAKPNDASFNRARPSSKRLTAVSTVKSSSRYSAQARRKGSTCQKGKK